MPSENRLQPDDAAVAARYLGLRRLLHDRFLLPVGQYLNAHYEVEPTRSLPSTLTCQLQAGFVRPGEGEIWPAAFFTPEAITLALCLPISSTRLASLGTVLNGPHRLKHRGWEDWWGWEATPAELHPQFHDLSLADQEKAALAWYVGRLEWLANNRLLRRRTRPATS